MSSCYGECLPKVEPVTRIFTTQFNELPVQHSSVPVESYNQHDYRTSERILPPPELDCILSASTWNPPYPVRHQQMPTLPTSYADLCEPRLSSTEAVMRSRAAVDDDHNAVSNYEGSRIFTYI